MAELWTDETHEVVARALERPCTCHFVDIGIGLQKAAEDPTCPRCTLFGQTNAILTALADAGVLIPVGGETRQEWRVVYRDRGNAREVDWSGLKFSREGADRSLRHALGSWPNARLQDRTVTDYPDGTVITSPWREVTDDPA